MTAVVLGPAEILSRALVDGVGDVIVVDTNTTADETMWQTLIALQGAHTSMVADGGRIVVILPTIGMSGAPRLVNYTAAIEGVRSMAKSAARQWGSEGIAVNIVAAPVTLFRSDVDESHLPSSAVPGGGMLIHSVVETAKFLLRRDIDHLTGQTIIVDGGSVMLP
ncbi:SDR family oxidoreductase [Mycobacterium asiaticum]|uniref:SDR family oxidoreductase n=1 Tax=Mycobacterium asiaticum TaxID=1790 RepID=UPI0009BD3930|nr:SDR family oxidoreductase [Mycobacterium asiaticum]